MKKALITLSLSLGVITQAFAQGQVTTANAASTAGTSLLGLLALAQTLVARLVPFMIGLAVVIFFYFLIMFIFKGSESGEKRTTYMGGMAFSVLALFVMVSIWGLVGFIGSLFGIGQGGSVPTPSIPIPA
jgi:hypothetical protein